MTGMLFISCHKPDVILPDEEPGETAAFTIPENFPRVMIDPDNPMTKEGIELGKQLFFDKRLSGNNQISCATCHRPELSYSDGAALNNIGVSGTTLLRHSPALINMAWANNGLFWDGGATNLESQAFGPLTAHDEMAQNLFELIEELIVVPEYVQLFDKAFRAPVTAANIVKALAQFQRSLVSANSRYDKYVRKEAGGFLSDEEKQGMLLVQLKCQPCHATDLFTDNLYHNNGLDDDFSDAGVDDIYLGRARVTYSDKDIGAYKTSTLRNIMVTAPYMHDGRFATIESVLMHYSEGVKYSPSLAAEMFQKENGEAGIPLSETEKKNIIAFMKALTDTGFLKK